MTDLLSLREGEIFDILKRLQQHDFVLIGGYAVNAYTLPRFSVDCDIVIRTAAELHEIVHILNRNGYAKKKLAGYSGHFERYVKVLQNGFAVSIDILIGTITDRMTNSSFTADWAFEHSRERVLKGKTIPGQISVRIIGLDALLVMKIVSCRATDIRDVFMLAPYAQDKEWIRTEVGARTNLHERVARIVEKVQSSQFRDGIAGVYGSFDSKVFEKHKNAVAIFLGA